MSDEKARFFLSISEGIVEVTGSELFVSQQIERLQGFISEGISAAKASSLSPVQVIQQKDEDEPTYRVSAEATQNENPYPRVLDVHNGKIKERLINGFGWAEIAA